MTDPNIHRELGEINAKLSFLIEAQQEAAESRLETNRSLQAAEVRMQRLESEASNVRRDLEEFRPVLIMVRRWEQRGIGAASVIAAIGATFGAAFVTFKDKIFHALGW